MSTIRCVLVAVTLMSCVLIPSADALIHVVGGGFGWGVPPTTNYYADWAKPMTFGVGDELVFPYTPAAQNVIQVSREDFDKCDTQHAIFEDFKGPTIFKLEMPGDYYFYCNIGTHCDMGQKLHINVSNQPGTSGMIPAPPRRLLLSAAAPESSDADTSPAAAPGPEQEHEGKAHAANDAVSYTGGAQFCGVIAFSLVSSMILI